MQVFDVIMIIFDHFSLMYSFIDGLNDSLQDKQSLIELFNATGGPISWRVNYSWAVPWTSICNWHGVVCSRVNYDDGSIVDYVSTLDLSSNQLTGTLPVSMHRFVGLGTLILRNNSLSGPFPTNLPKSLFKVDISMNELSGTLPSSSLCAVIFSKLP